MNKLNVFFNNVTNEIIQRQFHCIYFVICCYDHVFLLWHIFVYFTIVEFFIQNFCFFTNIELRRLHRRFEHFVVRRLNEILKRTKHNVEFWTLQHFIKYYKHCQMHEKSSRRFNFFIKKDDVRFNYNIVINIFYILNKFVLHFVNETICFQTEWWLKNISTKHV